MPEKYCPIFLGSVINDQYFLGILYEAFIVRCLYKYLSCFTFIGKFSWQCISNDFAVNPHGNIFSKKEKSIECLVGSTIARSASS